MLRRHRLTSLYLVFLIFILSFILNILVTGGAGFVGSQLAIALKKSFGHHQVLALDNLKRRGSELNLLRLRDAGVAFIHGDVRFQADLASLNPDWIIECSAEPSVLAGLGSDTDYLVHTNLLGTYHCLELARRCNAGMIFLSTSRVYPILSISKLPFVEHTTRFELEPGFSKKGISSAGINEEFSLDGSRTLYGTTKLASEFLVQEYCDTFSIPTVINRCGLLTGPWQMGKVDQGVIVLWLARHYFGGALSYIGYGGNGKQLRDVLHVSDLADVITLQLQHIEKHSGQTYNIGGGIENSVSLLELTRICQKLTNRKIAISMEHQERPGDLPWFVTDTRKFKEATGWSPQHSVESTLHEILIWLKENKQKLSSIFL